jgi:hypothetical protein
MTNLVDMFFALTLPLTAGSALDAACPDQYAPYRLNWTANMANERNLSGLPTMAFATSPDGPALPVELKFNGPSHAFEFDSPRVSGVGTGELLLEQSLWTHDEYTVTELLFNRHVTNLQMTIEDLDENRSFNGAYADTVMLGGANKYLDRTVEPFISQDGSSRIQNEARRDLWRKLGREDRLEVSPVATSPHTEAHWSSLKASFEAPVSYVKMTFGSNPDVFPPSHFSQRPGSQSIRITDVTFCVPFGSRVGD